MTTEYDIDAPADMELLGGTDDDQPESVAEGETPEEAEQKADKSANVEGKEVAEDPAPAKRDAVIPRARFDEVNAKLHAEREEVERLRAELNSRTATPAQDPVASTDDLEDQYFEAILEGDKAKAKGIRATINNQIYSQAEAASTAAVTRQISEREAKDTFAGTVSQTVAAYPFLDSHSADANPDAIADVVEWRDLYISKGDSPAVALQKAAAKVAPLYTSAPKPTTTDTRKQSALAAGARVTASQPPRVDAGVGNRTIPAGDSILGSQDKWEKASEAERMRYLQ